MGLRLRAELRASRDALCVVLARMWVGAVVLLTGLVVGSAVALNGKFGLVVGRPLDAGRIPVQLHNR